MYLLPDKITNLFKRLTPGEEGEADFTEPEKENKWRRRWQSLNQVQRFYFVAFVLYAVLYIKGWTDVGALLIPMLLTVIALVKEFGERFSELWNSLYGKAVILLFYAIVANFAMANAAGLVNEVSGVAADKLPYSHNFAIILNLPSWFVGTSVFGLLLYMTTSFFYLMLLLMLKPFGVHSIWHKPEYKYVFTTALLRLVLTMMSVAVIVTVMIDNGLQSRTSTPFGSINVGVQSEYEEPAEEKAPEQPPAFITALVDELAKNNSDDTTNEVDYVVDSTRTEAASVPQTDTENTTPEDAPIASVEQDAAVQSEPSEPRDEDEELEEFINSTVQGAENYAKIQKTLLADFIYTFEADTYSRCEHDENTRVIELNDYEILTIWRDTEADYGYGYEVIPCVSAAIGRTAISP